MTTFPVREHVTKVFNELFEVVPALEKDKTQVIVMSGGQTPYRNDTDRELPFRQESNFYYLSGCDLPDAHLVLVSKRGGNLERLPLIKLLIPSQDPLLIMWSPAPPTVDEAKQLYSPGQISSVSTSPELPRVVQSTLETFPDAVIHILPPYPYSPFPEQPKDFAETYATRVTHAYLLTALHKARLIKTPEEISLIQTANGISSRAHEVVMRLLGKAVKGLIHREKGGNPPLPGEWLIQKEAEAEAVFVASCRREGAVHQAYLPIVAASTRAATLHYCCNDKEFSWGPISNGHAHSEDLAHDEKRNLLPQVLLIDAGAEFHNYASDITRTMPVGNGGKFTPEAKDIYSLVLKMQNDSIKALKPSLHWDAVQLLCHRILIQGFLSLAIFKGSEEDILASGVSAAFFPHGVGHSIGLDVHDVPSASKPIGAEGRPFQSEIAKQTNSKFYDYLRLRLPLEAGMVVTVEPGCYFSPHLLAPVRDSPFINNDVLARYEPVGGVRIEDVVAITADGCDVLTTVGKEVEWVEGVCSGSL
ncbi:Creatinase/aminopeptidase [Hysterangium stoloniferum]|nr:Creatinase/aminopeptidase [Hysterangium stoloniferum]